MRVFALATAWLAVLLTVAGAPVAARRAAPAQAATAAAGGGRPVVLQLRPNFFMIAGAGGNVGVQIGDDGVVVVDSGSAANADAVVAAIKAMSPRPIRYVINTGPDGDHVGGNAGGVARGRDPVHRRRWSRHLCRFHRRRRVDSVARERAGARQRGVGREPRPFPAPAGPPRPSTSRASTCI